MSPSITSGVVGTFTTARTARCSITTASVLVPPTSTPMRNIYILPFTRDDASDPGRIGFYRNRSGHDATGSGSLLKRCARIHRKLLEKASQVEFDGTFGDTERARRLFVAV